MTVRLDPVTFALQLESARPSPVQHWNQLLSDLIAQQAIGPTRASRAYALFNTALYDLWAGLDPQAQTVYGAPSIPLQAGQLEPALHRLAAQVLRQWFPESAEQINRELATVARVAHASKEHVAQIEVVLKQQLLTLPALDPGPEAGPAAPPFDPAERRIDGWMPEHVPIDDPSAARESFLTPYWGAIPAFASDDVTALRPQGPEPFLLVDEVVASLDLAVAELQLEQDWLAADGTTYPAGGYAVADHDWLVGEIINPAFIQQAQDVVEIQRNLTDEQKLIAEFWESGSGTAFPPGDWIAIASFMADQQPLSLSEEIKLFFGVGQAVGDAGIAAWDAKLHFNYARPVRVIRDLQALGLLEGEELSSWQTYQMPGSNASPPFAEYVSGHSSFSAAAATYLEDFFGSDALGLRLEFAPGSSRFEQGVVPAVATTVQWDTLAQAAESAGISRLYGGIHFDDGNRHGLELGQRVGDAVSEKVQQLLYGRLDEAVLEPFAIRNQLDVAADGRLQLDGLALPERVQTIRLSSGDDVISLTPSSSFEGLVDGGSGVDTLRVAAASGPVLVDLEQGLAPGIGRLEGIERVQAGGGADVLIGSSADEWFEAGGGDDRLIGAGGWDTAIYRGKRRDYRFVGDAVVDQRDPSTVDFDGSDRLTGIEQLQFSDGTWPVSQLFTPITTQVALQVPDNPLVVVEGEPLTIALDRQGDLSDPLAVQLQWRSSGGVMLDPSTDLLPPQASQQWTVQLPAGESNLKLEWITIDDFSYEGREQALLVIAGVEGMGAADRLPPLEVQVSAQAVEVLLLDNDLPQALQPLGTSPLQQLLVPGQPWRMPLTYNALQAFEQPGFRIHYPEEAMEFLGWHPAADVALALEPSGVAEGCIDLAGEQPLLGAAPDGAALARPLGELRFQVREDVVESDLLLGVQLSPQGTPDPVPFASHAPQLELVDQWSLDFDGDGQVKALSDGLMLVRHLLGIRGDALLKRLGGQGERQTPEAVSAWISRGAQAGWLDFDGDGQTTALGDGLLMVRSLMGIRGGDLLPKAIGTDSPLLGGYEVGDLSGEQQTWVAAQIQQRIAALS